MQHNEGRIVRMLPWKCNVGFSFVLLSYVCHCWKYKIPNCCCGNIRTEISLVSLLRYICHCQQCKMFLGLHVMCVIFLSYFNQTLIKVPNTKYQEYLSSWSWVDSYGWTDRLVGDNSPFFFFFATLQMHLERGKIWEVKLINLKQTVQRTTNNHCERVWNSW